MIEENDLLGVLAERLHVTPATLHDCTLDPEVVKVIPQETANSHHMVPISRIENILTVAVSWVSAAWAEGILSQEEIERHPLRNVITKAVGAKESIDVEVLEHRFQAGDLCLLCSDGLHSMISDTRIHEALGDGGESLEAIAERLIAAANEGGGKDNVSVVLLRYTE